MTNDKERFREALIDWVHRSGISVADLARKTGISKGQLDKLMQRRVAATNVDDAARLARFFGCTVEDFLGSGVPGGEDGTALSRIRVLVGQLSPDEQDMLEAQIAGLISRKQKSR